MEGSGGIRVRGLEVDPPLFLAPMAGLTHTALRRVIARLGQAGCLFTEMLSARALRSENPSKSPFLVKTGIESPLCYQILASNPREVEEGIEAVRRFGADAVDLNFGCPAPEIRRRGGGSRLMEDRGTALGVVASARRAAGPLPLSAKIRLGETLDEERLADFCRMLEGEGIDLLHVHARLRGEPYGRKPRWDWIAKVKNTVRVPVVANGSVVDALSAAACLALTGADGLMIGRAAAQKPWVFAEIAHEVYGRGPKPPVPDMPAIYREFTGYVKESFEPLKRLGRIKEFTRYFALNYAFGHSLFTAVNSSGSVEEAEARALEFFERNK